MKMGEGVEWALHCCILLHWAEREAIPAAKLAEFHDLPAAYLNKQLQALGRAGVLTSVPGPRGGFRLARLPERITLMDVVAAIEGPEDAFRCTEIRKQGPAAGSPASFRPPCSVATAMWKAELAWRRALAEQTLADVIAAAEGAAPGAPARVRRWFENVA
jgi:Rrf2 family protein